MSGHSDHTPEVHSELDEWHQHGSEEGVPQKEHGSHANIAILLGTFVVITVSTVVFAVAIGVYSLSEIERLRGDREAQGLSAVAPDTAAYKHAALAAQEGYGWTEDGKVRLPIERAMELVIDEKGDVGG